MNSPTSHRALHGKMFLLCFYVLFQFIAGHPTNAESLRTPCQKERAEAEVNQQIASILLAGKIKRIQLGIEAYKNQLELRRLDDPFKRTISPNLWETLQSWYWVLTL